MRLSTKIAVLSILLVADISFFLFFKTYFAQDYELVFQLLPWQDDIEKTVAIIIGLVIAILTSFLIGRVILNHLLKSIRGD